MQRSRVLVGMAIVLVLAAGALLAWASRAEMPPVDSTPAPADAATVQRGRNLAAIGDCLVCHTAPGGRAFAGGRALETPFGTIYGTNLTPDPDTGIGRWSEAAFVRAMREGIDRAGNHLYPAFPYDHFTRVTDDDLRAIYAYLRTVDPVSARPPRNELRFPFNLRPLLAGWKLLYLDRGVYQPVPGQSAQWNRGAYLVTGLGHCGACHTPRNRLGAERKNEALAGGEAEGWHAPALTAASPAPIPWTAEALFTYLRTGIAPRHDASGGPMSPITHDLATVPEEDVRAIAVYLASVAGPPSPERTARAESIVNARASASTAAPAADGTGELGRSVYEGACASCHDSGRSGFFKGGLGLRLSTSVHAPSPANLVQIVVNGIVPADGDRGAWMPAFGSALTDDQVAALAHYLRTTVAQEAPWQDVDAALRNARRATPAS